MLHQMGGPHPRRRIPPRDTRYPECGAGEDRAPNSRAPSLLPHGPRRRVRGGGPRSGGRDHAVAARTARCRRNRRSRNADGGRPGWRDRARPPITWSLSERAAARVCTRAYEPAATPPPAPGAVRRVRQRETAGAAGHRCAASGTIPKQSERPAPSAPRGRRSARRRSGSPFNLPDGLADTFRGRRSVTARRLGM